jgi:hypothetical protein
MWFGGHHYHECKMNLWRLSDYVACDMCFEGDYYNECPMSFYQCVSFLPYYILFGC